MEDVGAALGLAASIVCDLCDLAITANDCLSGNCSWLALAGAVLPVVPVTVASKMGKGLEEALGLLPASLSDKATRDLYIELEKMIPGAIEGLPLEDAAKLASALRNQFRDWARASQADTAKFAEYAAAHPNLSWDQVVAKYTARGYTGDDLWRAIIEASQRTNPDVNRSYGLDP